MTLAVCEVLINARFDYVDAYTHTNKFMNLPWFIGTIVASAVIFGKSWFFVYAHRLGKAGCQLYTRSSGKRLIEIVISQVYHARNYVNGSLRLRVIRFMHGNLGSFAHWRNIRR